LGTQRSVTAYGLLSGLLPEAATPTFTPAAGTYGSAQSVTIADATPGATIYYTPNGTAPTTGSAVYSGAIPVSASETLQPIAGASGYATSAVGSAVYTIGSTSSPVVDDPSGFSGATGLSLVGHGDERSAGVDRWRGV
jgi:Chitobiase/beta-hexosaminidase C-terminal domain